MADQQQEQDATEAATPFKLEEARKKGVVASSAELRSAFALTVALFVATAFGTWCTTRVLYLSKVIFSNADRWVFDAPHVAHKLADISRWALFVLSPVLAIVSIGAILSNIIQTGPVFSGEPLRPDFQRLNPASGLKRLFSVRSLFELVKSGVKLGLYCAVVFTVLRNWLPKLPTLYQEPKEAYPILFVHYGNRLLFDLLIAVIAVAILDLLFTRWEFGRRMRMSRRELKDEVKRREGDPQIRSKRRQLQREMRKRSSSTGKVKDSDVLITNPTHYAVALKYRRGEVPAPEVLAKGAGLLAQRMREVAFRSRVPIMSNPRLAKALFEDVQIGAMVPEAHFEAVANVMKWVYEMRKRNDVRGRDG